MSGRRRRSESLWEKKEEDLEANDTFLSPMDPAFDDWDNQYTRPPPDQTYRGGSGNMSKDRDRSRSPHRNRGRDRDSGRVRSRSRSKGRDPGRGRSPVNDERRELHESTDTRNESRNRNRSENDSGGSRFRNDRNSDDRSRMKGSDGFRKDGSRNRNTYDDQDHRRQANQSTKTPCRFFIMGNCNRNNCKFSHDVSESDRKFDDKNKEWNDLESGGFDQNIIPNVDMVIDNSDAFNLVSEDNNNNDNNMSSRRPSNLNGNEKSSDFFTNGSGQKPTETLEASRNDISLSLPQKVNDENAPELLSSLPNPGSSAVDSTVVNKSMKSSQSTESQTLIVDENPKREEENANVEKSEAQGKVVDEGNIGNEEKAMRLFKVALVEFVKEVLKPTWKEGKMSREVYKTIVKKVVDKVSSTIQGVQIPKTQEKIDQYLAFSKSKITKLVEAYVGRFQKA